MVKLSVKAIGEMAGKKEMLKKVVELKGELMNLRVAQRANAGQTTKLGKIKQVRKNIARVLTVVNQNARAAYHKQLKPKDMAPKALREKKTRAIRRRLTPAQASKKTLKSHKKAVNFPLRKYSIKA